MKSTPPKPAVHGETLDSLPARLQAEGHSVFRARQIMEWLYKARVRTWDGMPNPSRPLRTWRAATFELEPTGFVLTKQSEDVTDKLLLELGDRSLIETVIIRAPQLGVGQENSRKTICISTQVGCAMGCKFCASGLEGLKRNLSAGEIVHQLIQVCRQEDDGATDEVREQIMPINKKWPLKELLPAVREFSEKHGRMVTLEFILIADVNDSLEQAEKLRDIAYDLHAHVNLIPYNTVEGLPWKRPGLTRQEKFARILFDGGVSVTLRREKGHAIDAACGQLRLKTEKAREAAT